MDRFCRLTLVFGLFFAGLGCATRPAPPLPVPFADQVCREDGFRLSLPQAGEVLDEEAARDLIWALRREWGASGEDPGWVDLGVRWDTEGSASTHPFRSNFDADRAWEVAERLEPLLRAGPSNREAQQYGVPVKIVRPFNNYGPGLNIHDGRVLPDFARNVLSGRDVVMHSDGSPTRTFCYVEDAIVGYVRALVRGRSGEPYNIGVREPEISMLELAERVVAWARDAVGYSGRVVQRASEERDYLIDNPNRRCPIIDKAVDELGYDPQVGLDDGLDRTMTWYAGTWSFDPEAT